MSERLRRACRAGGVGLAMVVLVTACAAGRAGVDPIEPDRDAVDERTADETDSRADADGADDPPDAVDRDGGEDGEAAGEIDGDVDDEFPDPTPEGTSPEAPAEIEIDVTTIEVATLPIGGSADDAGESLQCVDVGWSDPPEIPPGVRVVIRDLLLEPAGDFTLAEQPCPGDAPACLPDHDLTPERRCTVSVAWTAQAGTAGGRLRASGTILCDADAEVCSAFEAAVAERGGDSIDLLPPLTGPDPSETAEDQQDAGEPDEGALGGGEPDGGEPDEGEPDGGGPDGAEGAPENGQG